MNENAIPDEWDRAYRQGRTDMQRLILEAIQVAFPKPTLGIQTALRIIKNIGGER